MYTASNFGQLGLIVIQEAVLGTALVMVVYFAVRVLFRALETSSAAGKRNTKLDLQPAEPATVLHCAAETQELVLQ